MTGLAFCLKLGWTYITFSSSCHYLRLLNSWFLVENGVICFWWKVRTVKSGFVFRFSAIPSWGLVTFRYDQSGVFDGVSRCVSPNVFYLQSSPDSYTYMWLFRSALSIIQAILVSISPVQIQIRFTLERTTNGSRSAVIQLSQPLDTFHEW